MIRQLKIFSLVLVASLMGFHASAMAVTLKGVDGLMVQLYKAPEVGDGQYLMKISGAGSVWDDKVFAVEGVQRPNYTAYSFTYDVELSSGVKTHDYTILVSSGSVLKDGSLLDRYELHLPEHKEALIVWLEPDAESHAEALKAEFEANPFKPDPNQ